MKNSMVLQGQCHAVFLTNKTKIICHFYNKYTKKLFLYIMPKTLETCIKKPLKKWQFLLR